MRSFPGALVASVSRRRWTTLLATLVVLAGVLSIPLADANDLKHKQNHVRSQIKHAQHDLDESSAGLRRATTRLIQAQGELKHARKHLGVVRKRLAQARRDDARMAKRLAHAKIRLTNAQEALAAGQQAVADQRDVVSDTVSQMYEQGAPELRALASVLSAQSTADLTRGEELNRTVIDRQNQIFNDLTAAEERLAEREADVQAATNEVAAQRQAAADHLVVMKRLTQQAVAAKKSVIHLVSARRSARHDAVRARKRDRATLSRLHKREDRIRRQILAAQRRQRGGGISVNSHGFLLPPVTGPITSPYGYRIHPIYGYWGLHDGTDFGVSCGEGMRAAGDGVVTQRYWSDVYGNRLYVSLGTVNGKNLTVIYNHASGYRVNVGDHVRRGEIVGYVGDTGWSTGCHLHFTVLVNGTAVDPENWL